MKAAAEMPRYRSHKTVRALKIKTVTPMGEDSTVDENSIVMIEFEDHRFAAKRCNLQGKPTPEAGWYYVVYENEYWSFSPAKAFEEGNTLLSGPQSLGEFIEKEATAQGAEIVQGFGWAIKQMHNGALVARKGWNGKGMFIFLVPGSKFTVNRHPLLGIFPEGTEISYRPHIDMKTVDGEIVPWVASQSDLLATDWEIAV